MKFLMVKFGGIGDCVLTAHAATSVRIAHPDAFIAWALEDRFLPVLSVRDATESAEGLVDLPYKIPRLIWKERPWSPLTWWAIIRHYSRLRRHRFDMGADMRGHSKTALCLYLAKPRKRIAAR